MSQKVNCPLTLAAINTIVPQKFSMKSQINLSDRAYKVEERQNLGLVPVNRKPLAVSTTLNGVLRVLYVSEKGHLNVVQPWCPSMDNDTPSPFAYDLIQGEEKVKALHFTTFQKKPVAQVHASPGQLFLVTTDGQLFVAENTNCREAFRWNPVNLPFLVRDMDTRPETDRSHPSRVGMVSRRGKAYLSLFPLSQITCRQVITDTLYKRVHVSKSGPFQYVLSDEKNQVARGTTPNNLKPLPLPFQLNCDIRDTVIFDQMLYLVGVNGLTKIVQLPSAEGKVSEHTNLDKLCASPVHLVFLDKNGTARGQGSNNFSQCGLNLQNNVKSVLRKLKRTRSFLSKPVKLQKNVQEIFCWSKGTVLLKNDGLYYCGRMPTVCHPFQGTTRFVKLT